MPLTIGTAGHVDHGKTWLVRALTGIDTDRLPEEKARGISIDLGYAQLELDDGRRLSLIDVPGHERFVRNMVAGAMGIDLFLLVIDGAEGVMPQTLEHLAILRLLGIDKGVVAVTKADSVDEEILTLALAEASELVPRAEVVAVSARTGAGLDRLRSALGRAAASVEERRSTGAARLYIDRIFTIRGIGTVVTGTLWSGAITGGDSLRVEPAGLDVRVRGVHVHDREVERAEAGQRVAVNLAGIEPGRLRRGDALVGPGPFAVTYRLDVRLEPMSDELPRAITVHIGTADRPARVAGTGEYVQLRLARPLLAARGDPVILRTSTTVGGGRVLDPSPQRRLDVERMRLLSRGDPAELARALIHEPVSAAAIEARGLLTLDDLTVAGKAVEHAAGFWYSQAWLDELRGNVRARLEERRRRSPLAPGIPLAELLPREPWAPAIMGLLGIDRRNATAYLPGTSPSLDRYAEEAERLEQAVRSSEVVKVDDRALALRLEEEGRLRRVGDGYAISVALYDRGLATVRAQSPLSLAAFRDAMGLSRKTAQLLLERYDSDGLTRRQGDVRVLRRAGRAQL